MSYHRVMLVTSIPMVIMLGLVGCTGHVSAPASSASSPAARTQPTPFGTTASAQPALHGIVATGTLTSANSDTSGTVVLTAANGVITATLEDFTTTATGDLELSLTTAGASTPCLDDGGAFQMNPVADGQSDAWSLPIDAAGGPFTPDPSALQTAVLRGDPATTPNPNNCLLPPLAVATLQWNITPSTQSASR